VRDGILGCGYDLQSSILDAPALEDETAAWALVQKGMQATKKTPREKMYLDPLPRCTKTQGRVEIRAR